MATRVRLQLLRSPQLLRPDGRGAALNPKDAALLALLAVDGPTTRERIVALLWPGDDEAVARNTLRQRLFRLKRAAGAEIVRSDGPLALRSEVEHDLQGLERALEADPQARAGELLGELRFDELHDFADWLAGARQRWRSARGDRLAEIASRLEAQERIAAALACAERLARDEPLLEHAQRRLMKLHYRRGDRSAALAVFERLRRRLDEELGETPSPETQELVALIEASLSLPVATPPPSPLAVLRPPRLIGREREWALLEQAWSDGRLVVVRGEPGIGKSRLLEEFTGTHGLPTALQARPGDEHIAYALLTRLLRALFAAAPATLAALEDGVRAELARVLPELGAIAAGTLDATRLAEAAERVIERVAPAAIAVDDLQFADAATLQLLPTLGGARGATRWLVTLRSAEPPAGVRDWLAGLDLRHWSAVDLQPLDAPAVERLLDSLGLPQLDAAAWAPRLHRHTGGNPMFVLETLLAVLRGGSGATAGELPVPAHLGELLARRLGQLGPGALKLSRVAAVAGQDFGLALAAQVLHCAPLDLADDWQELQRARVFDGERFVHDLVAEAARRSLPAPIAHWLHAAVAEWGADHGMAPARVAAHWREAQQPQRAARVFFAAGQAAAEAGRNDEQIALLEQAADCAEAAGDRALVFDALRWLLVGLLSGRPGEGAPRQFERLIVMAGDDFRRGEARRLEAVTRMTMSDFAGTAAAAEAAVADFERYAGAEDARSGRLFALITRSTALARAGRGAAALASLDDVLPQVLAHPKPPANLLPSFLGEKANVLIACERRHEALRVVDEGLAAARRSGNRRDEHSMLRIAAQIRLQLGQCEAAHREAAQAVALHEQIGAARGVALQGQVLLGWACRELGRYEEALQWLDDACTALRRTALHVIAAEAEHQLSQTWLQLGRADRAEQALGPLDAGAPPFVHLARALHRIALAVALERPAVGLAETLRAAEGCAETRSYERLRLRLLHCRVEVANDVGAALAIADDAVRAELPSLQVLALGQAAQALALADPPRAAALARQVLETIEHVQPFMAYRPGLAWQMCGLLGDEALAQLIRQRFAEQVLSIARTQVPDEYRDSFLNRNRANRALLAAAGWL